MTDREMELKLKKAVEACTPDVLDNIMAACNKQAGQVVPIRKKTNSLQRWIAIAAVFAVVIGAGAFGIFGQMANRIVSTVSLEVNPSIELKLNKNEEIVTANALNTDAEKILEGMKLDGVDVHTATNAIIGSLLKHGYIDELANSILLSVEDADAAHGERLQAELAEEINAILDGASVNAAILSQYVQGNEYESVSQEYKISKGKAALINQIMAANNTYQMEELAALSVNELNLILSNSKNHVTGVQSTGNASDGAYIGAESAKVAALKHAGVAETDVRGMDIEMDYDYHRMVYEVEFHAGGVEYEYGIDALTGEVVDVQKEGQGSSNDDWEDDD